MQEALLASELAAVELLGRKPSYTLRECGVMRAHAAFGCEHLVIGLAELVAGIGRIAARAQLGQERNDLLVRQRLRSCGSLMLHVRNVTGIAQVSSRGF